MFIINQAITLIIIFIFMVSIMFLTGLASLFWKLDKWGDELLIVTLTLISLAILFLIICL